MIRSPLLLLLITSPALADDAASALCRTNPAYSLEIMRSVVESQLQRDHDPSLDTMTPDQLAAAAQEQGVRECVADMRRDPVLFATLSSLGENDRGIGWDAYNSACGDRGGGKGNCVKAEIFSQQALRVMLANDRPPGARAIAQTCELVLQADPAMAEWRECVDLGLAAHAAPEAAARCKLSVTWHATKSGAEAGKMLAACLRGGS